MEATSADGAVVTFDPPSATDFFTPVTIECTTSDPGGAIDSGDTFPLGTTTITCTATDANGVESEPQSFTITVQDTTAPVLTVPDDQTVEATSADGAVVTFDPPSATDFFTPVTIECLSDTTGLNSGDTFPLGTTTITCTATDANGVESEPQSFTITVQDTTAPVLTVPDDQTVEATSADGAVVTFDPPSATDFFTPVTIECTTSDPGGAIDSGDTFPLGTTTITCTATDANGVESEPQSFTITVQDTTAPVLTVPDDQTVEATSADGAVVTFDPPSATDFFTPVTIECTTSDPGGAIDSGDTFPLGTTTITCTATDANGVESEPQSFTITVQDTTAPVLTVPDDQTVEATSADGAVVTFDPPSATDFFTPVTIECTTSDPGGAIDSGDTFPLGTTTITCTSY